LLALKPHAAALLQHLSAVRQDGKETEWTLILGASPKITQLAATEARLRGVYEAYGVAGAHPPPSVVEQLERVPRRIDELTATDRHACPPGCRCRVATIRHDVENWEWLPRQVTEDCRGIESLLRAIDTALEIRGVGVEITRLPAQPATSGVTIITQSDAVEPSEVQHG
jgi:hypothetical protein